MNRITVADLKGKSPLKHTSTAIRSADESVRITEDIVHDDHQKIVVNPPPPPKVFTFEPIFLDNKLPLPMTRDDKAFQMHRWIDGKWQTDVEGGVDAFLGKSLRVLTVNVWFDQWMWQQRANALIALIKELNPDVVCLQEVTEHFVRYFSNAARDLGYGFSDINGDTIMSYGVIMLIKHRVDMLVSYHLTSKMLRRCMCAKISNLVVATVHLESLGFYDTREMQLMELSMRFEHGNLDCLLVGDMNVDGSTNRHWEARNGKRDVENDVFKRVSPKSIDLWIELRPEEEGLTFVSGPELARYDRVMLHPIAGKWKPKNIEIVADKPIPGLHGRGRPVTISDHYGLLAEIERL